MDPLHPYFIPYPSLLQSASRLSPTPPPTHTHTHTLSLSLSLSLSPNPAPMLTTSRRIQCNASIDLVLLYPVYVCYIVILFVSLTDEATIKAKRFICFWKESRVTLSFVVKSKLVTIFYYSYLHSYSYPLQLHWSLGLIMLVLVVIQELWSSLSFHLLWSVRYCASHRNGGGSEISWRFRNILPLGAG